MDTDINYNLSAEEIADQILQLLNDGFDFESVDLNSINSPFDYIDENIVFELSGIDYLDDSLLCTRELNHGRTGAELFGVSRACTMWSHFRSM